MLRRHVLLATAGAALALGPWASMAEAQVPKRINRPAPAKKADDSAQAKPAETKPATPAKGEEAQGENGGRRGFQMPGQDVGRMISRMGAAALLQMPPIQEELKMDDAQKEKLKNANDILNEQRSQSMRAMRDAARANAGEGGGPGGGGPGGGFDFGQMRQAMEEMRQQGEQALLPLLGPKQRARLQQILWQAQGFRALADPTMAQQLNLTPGQQQQIVNILAQMDQAEQQMGTRQREVFVSMRNPRNPGENGQGNPAGLPATISESEAKAGSRRGQGPAGDLGKVAPPAPAKEENDDDNDDGNNRRRGGFQMSEETLAKIEALRKESEALREKGELALAKVLTSRQKTNYNKLLGPKFDMEQLSFGRGGRGGGGFPGGGFPGGGGPGGGGAPGGGRRGNQGVGGDTAQRGGN